MPSLIVEDIAPFLRYSPSDQWRHAIRDLTLSSGGSVTVTETINADACFSFYGTGVGIYGSKRQDSGKYRVRLDDSNLEPRDGNATADAWDQELFKDSALPKGNHTVCHVNLDAKFRDLDYMIFEPSIGNGGETVTVHAVQDTHPSFAYDPPGHWAEDAPDAHSYSGGTGHATNFFGATAKLSFKLRLIHGQTTNFEGDAIALYGPAGTEATSFYTVKLDNGTAEGFSASTFDFKPLRAQQLMYFRGNLGPGEHELLVRLEASSLEQFLAIDYAQIFTTPSIGGDAPLLEATSSNASNQLPVGLIAGIAVLGSITFISLVLLLWVFLLIKKGKLRRVANPGATSNQPDPSLLATRLRVDGRSPGQVPVPYFISPVCSSNADTLTRTLSSSDPTCSQGLRVLRKSRNEGLGERVTQPPPPVYSNP
ncbi:hypothetical protein BKA70DRAFT_1521498 [Coprinopsis sp. MPI-PUGE-AT-0042]|nr:hypothetical protein BKA70DRAFT_1521498 [Coprinopsis sp. MPI-PUGE-AT-0042]